MSAANKQNASRPAAPNGPRPGQHAASATSAMGARNATANATARISASSTTSKNTTVTMRPRDTSSTGATGATSATANRGATPGRKLKFGDPEFQKLEKIAEDNINLLKEETKKHYEEHCEPDPTGEVRYGGRLLHNRNEIHKQRLFKVAQEAPKGAHLHIHLNACLGPSFLLEIAASEELENNMYISVNLQDQKKVEAMQNKRRVTKDKVRNMYGEPLTSANIATAKFQFHFLPYRWDTTCSLFDPKYRGRIDPTEKAEEKTYDVMKFTDFLRSFDARIKEDSGVKVYLKEKSYSRCMNWLIKRLVFQPEEVVFPKHKIDKASKTEPAAIKRYVAVSIMEELFGANRFRQWDLFNTRTQMMKGLFLAETAYRKYLRALFSSFDSDKIQYAELRPNFMKANSVIRTSDDDKIYISNKSKSGPFHFDPKKMMDNRGIMDMIIGEFTRWKDNHPRATFKSMKVIMCTPRSRPYPDFLIEDTMKECYEMKQEAKYKDWIAGFDFVGSELDGRTLKELEPQFNAWKAKYAKVGLEWILHCGESVYDSTPDKDKKRRDHNIKYALDNLNPKRLAHGYAIPTAGLGQGDMAKLRGICIETCPDSNEDLGLAFDASCAAVHPLMAENIPCSVSCDNPTLFNSTLSHQFYQVMVGRETFGLKGWKKLMIHSINHSVWNNAQDRKEVMDEWEAKYVEWVQSVAKNYGPRHKAKPPTSQVRGQKSTGTSR